MLRTLLKSFGRNRYARALVSKFTTSAPWFWHTVDKVPPLRKRINRLFINFIAASAPPRPHPFSLWGPAYDGKPASVVADYTSWTSLTDRSYTNRQLPVAEDAYLAALPPLEDLRAIFQRPADAVRHCGRSSALFCFFAQWLTDSFLRTHPKDWRRNTSNQELDLCQIYGLTVADTDILRSHSGGKLLSQWIERDGVVAEFPPYLFDVAGVDVRDRFIGLSYIDPATRNFHDPTVLKLISVSPFNEPGRRAKLYASGLERGNSSIIYSALNIIFLREHNRLCDVLAAQYPDWDDNRLFETARNINIAQYLTIIIEDYIAHISPTYFKMFVEVGWAETQDWYRTNRISAEFNLLYRWHQLIPEHLSDGEEVLQQQDYRFNNDLLETRGLAHCMKLASRQAAGALSLCNTADFLVDADIAAMEKSRAWRIRSFQDYREHFGMPPLSGFEDLTGEKELAAKLSHLYGGDVRRVEFVIGLLAEAREKRDVLAPLMTLMVGYDAFSHALTNPLLAARVYNAATFSAVGLKEMGGVKTLAGLLARNTSQPDIVCSFAATKEPPGTYGPPLLKKIYDTADFLWFSGWRSFLERRAAKFGSSVFRVNLFQKTVVALDHSAIKPLFDSTALKQDYGFSWAVPPLDLVGGIAPSIFEAGDKHDKPKQLYLRMLEDANQRLDQVYNDVADAFLRKWDEQKTFSFKDELEDFAITLVFKLFLGVAPSSPSNMRLVYLNIFNHVFGWITRYLPWSTYAKSLRLYPGIVEEIKKAPRFNNVLEWSKELGLTNVDDYIAHQIAFLLGMNSFLGTQSFLKSILGELSMHPELADVLRDADGAKRGVREGFLCEVLRLHPPVFFVFGRATQDQLIKSSSGTFALNQGELLMGAIALAHRDPHVFDNPEQFDPMRYRNEKARSHLIWPRGGHDQPPTARDKACPGKDIAMRIAQRFLETLLLRCEWVLVDKKLTWSDHKFTLNVAAPEGDMRTSSFTLQARK